MFCKSSLRPIRHTCIVVSATIGYSIIDIIKEESDEKIVFERQFKNYKKNKSDKKRIDTVKKEIKEVKTKIDYLEDVIDEIFDEIIEIRLKDSMPEIRLISLRSIGLWLKN